MTATLTATAAAVAVFPEKFVFDFFQRNALVRHVYMLVDSRCPCVAVTEHHLNISIWHAEIFLQGAVGVAKPVQGDDAKVVLSAYAPEGAKHIACLDGPSAAGCEDEFSAVAAALP